MAVRVYVSNYEKKIYVMLCREYVCIIEGRELIEPDMTAKKMVKVNGSRHQQEIKQHTSKGQEAQSNPKPILDL